MQTTNSRHLFAGKLFCFALIFGWLGCSDKPGGAPRVASAEAQERVAELIQNVLGPYRREGSLTNGSTNTSSITYTNIERNFREASMLMPERLDLRFGIASALIGQAIQTNTDFALKMKSALAVYQEIHALDTHGFQSAILYAAYTRAIGETNASGSALKKLAAAHPEKTRSYLEKFQRIDNTLQLTSNEDIQKIRPVGDHAIVILGAALESNAAAKPKLVARLHQALLLAKLSPDSPIIVTGGNPRAGVTEAYAMGRWLIDQGISTNRLHLEDRATDTVGNAIRTCAILQKLHVTGVTLVTSASHMRRALADFEEAAVVRGLHLTFSHLASRDELDLDPARERVSVYRDALRTSGLWSFPGIQR